MFASAVVAVLTAGGTPSLLSDDWRTTAFDDAEPGALRSAFGPGRMSLTVAADPQPGARAKRTWSFWQPLPSHDPNGTLKLTFEARKTSPRPQNLICSPSGSPGMGLPAFRNIVNLTDIWKDYTVMMPMAGAKPDGVFEILWEGVLKKDDSIELRNITLVEDAEAAKAAFGIRHPLNLSLLSGGDQTVSGYMIFPEGLKGGTWSVSLGGLTANGSIDSSGADWLLDAAKLPAGAYEVVFTTVKDGRSVSQRKPLLKGPGAKRMFTVSGGRFMRNGKPFLPLILSHAAPWNIERANQYAEGGKTVSIVQAYDDIVAHGFNTVHGMDKDIVSFALAVAAHGLLVMPHLRADTVETVPSNLLAWYGVDEAADAVARARGRMWFDAAKRGTSPQLVISANYEASTLGSFRREGAFADVFEYDLFDIRSAKTDFTRYSEELEKVGKILKNMPDFVFGISPQMFIYNGPEPTPEQLRVQVYLGLVHGARSVNYYSYTEDFAKEFTSRKAQFPELPGGMSRNPKRTHWWICDSDLWDSVGALNGELKLLEPYIFAEPEPEKLVSLTRGIACSVRKAGGGLTLVAVNARPEPVVAHLRSDEDLSFNGRFGGAGLSLKSGENEVFFAPYEVKVLATDRALGLLRHADRRTAEELEKMLVDRFRDTNGVLRCVLDADLRPIVDDNPPPVTGMDCTRGGWMSYENSGMVQGAFLAAMCEKYRATGDPSALAEARRTYSGIRKVYELSRPGGRGFYCKPWGMRYQAFTSSDQYVYTLYGLDALCELVEGTERDEIREMIVDMATFWIVRSYRYRYFGEEPMQWQKCRFLAFAALGWKHSKDERFRKELERLQTDERVTGDVPFRASVALGEYELEPGYVVYFICGESALSGYLSVAAGLDENLDCAYERNLLPVLYEYATSSIAPDGSGYRVLVKNQDGSFAEMDSKRSKTNAQIGPPPWNDLACRTDGPYRYGGSASVAAVCALVRMAAHDRKAAVWVRERAAKVLTQVANGHLAGIEDPHGLFSPEYAATLKNCCRGEALADWLWAYWSIKAHSNTWFKKDER